jgi:hypothetical protein
MYSYPAMPWVVDTGPLGRGTSHFASGGILPVTSTPCLPLVRPSNPRDPKKILAHTPPHIAYCIWHMAYGIWHMAHMIYGNCRRSERNRNEAMEEEEEELDEVSDYEDFIKSRYPSFAQLISD